MRLDILFLVVKVDCVPAGSVYMCFSYLHTTQDNLKYFFFENVEHEFIQSESNSFGANPFTNEKQIGKMENSFTVPFKPQTKQTL